MLRNKLSAIIIVTFLTSLAGTNVVMAKDITDSNLKQSIAIDKLKVNTKDNKKFKIQWDEKTNAPTFISGDLSSEKISFQKDVLKFLEDNKDVFSIENGEFRIIKCTKDKKGNSHYRVSLFVDGIPVYGNDAVVHVDKNGKVYSINGKMETKVTEKEINKKVKIKDNKIIDIAESKLGINKKNTVYIDKPTSKLYIYKSNEKVQPAYEVQLVTLKPSIQKLKAFINAESGEIIEKYDELNKVGEELSQGKATKGKGTTLSGEDVAINTYYENGRYYLKDTTKPGNAKIITADLNHGEDEYQPGKVIEDTDNNFNSANQRAGVSSHINMAKVFDYYYNEFGRNSIDDNGMDLKGAVHLGNNLNNAFWTGYQMVFGDGDGIEFSPLSGSLDVVAHELTHGVTQYTSNLEYKNQSGALNEAMSDIMGVACEAYINGEENTNWLIGDEVYTPNIPGDGLRDMESPSKNGNPEHMDDYYNTVYDHGGVHTNSGIIEKAAYNIGSVIGKRELGKIFYKLNTDYLVRTSDFNDARNGAVQAAEDLYGKDSIQYKTVMNGFHNVGIGEAYIEKNDEPKVVKGWNVQEKEIINNTKREYIIKQPGAQGVGVYFDSIFVSPTTKICIYDSKNRLVKEFNGKQGKTTAAVNGDTMRIVAESSSLYALFNYKIDKVAYYYN